MNPVDPTFVQSKYKSKYPPFLAFPLGSSFIHWPKGLSLIIDVWNKYVVVADEKSNVLVTHLSLSNDERKGLIDIVLTVPESPRSRIESQAFGRILYKYTFRTLSTVGKRVDANSNEPPFR